MSNRYSVSLSFTTGKAVIQVVGQGRTGVRAVSSTEVAWEQNHPVSLVQETQGLIDLVSASIAAHEPTVTHTLVKGSKEK